MEPNSSYTTSTADCLENHDDSWLNYSELDQDKFTISLALFSLCSSLLTHPLNVLMTRQQAGISSSENNNKRSSQQKTHKSLTSSPSVASEMINSAKTIGVTGTFNNRLHYIYI